MIAFYGRFLDGSVHALNLTVGPRVPDFGQAVFDAVFLATQVEHVRHPCCCRAIPVAWRQGELDTVVGENRVDFVWNGFDKGNQKRRGGNTIGLFDKMDKGKFACAINGNVKIELSLSRLNLGNVDMEITDGIGLELLLPGFVALHFRQSGNAMARQATVQGRAGQMRDGWLKRVEAIIERQQRVSAKRNDNGFFLNRQNR